MDDPKADILGGFEEVCQVCLSENPPENNSRKYTKIKWIQCDQCDKWYHMSCLKLKKIPSKYTCPECLSQ